MTDPNYQLYDRIFKKILTLSSKSVINLINGLFDTDYPLDSTITYNWTEFHDDELKRILADTILTINNRHSYHLEAQMTIDENIIIRVFEYGFRHAKLSAKSDFHDNPENNSPYSCTLRFPEAKVIYFNTKGTTPDKYTLNLDFGSQGIFSYKISTFKYLETSPDELTKRKMIILIPFELLKLREEMKKERTPNNLSALKHLIFHDIIGVISKNLEAGNITVDDARKLKRLTHKLYEHIYSNYEEMEDLNEMTDESLMLDIDILEKEHEKQLKIERQEGKIEGKIEVFLRAVEKGFTQTDAQELAGIDDATLRIALTKLHN